LYVETLNDILQTTEESVVILIQHWRCNNCRLCSAKFYMFSYKNCVKSVIDVCQ